MPVRLPQAMSDGERGRYTGYCAAAAEAFASQCPTLF